MKSRRPFLNPAIDRLISAMMALSLVVGQMQIGPLLVGALFFGAAPRAEAARLGTSPVSAGSVPPPAASTINSFQPDLFTGRASTGIPIAVPPGRKGIQPSIALGYSSSSRNGWLGVGWSLDLGFIERSTRSGVPKYDNTDTFFFSLNNVNSELVRLVDGTYRAKDEGGFLKVEDRGPEGWMIRDKSGTRYLFGQADTSRVVDGDNVFRWHLDKVVDVSGNSMTLDYAKHGGIAYPKTIEYTASETTLSPPACRVDFLIEDRPDEEVSYRTGYLTRTAKRLSAIETKVKINGILSLAHRYELAYRQSRLTGRSLLASIREVGTDGVTGLPPVTYTYQEESAPVYDVVRNQRSTGQIAWNVRVAAWDVGHENFGCVPPYSSVPYGNPVTVAAGSSHDFGGPRASVSGDGSIRIDGRQDYFIHAWTAVYVSTSRNGTVQHVRHWDVGCMYVEDSSGIREVSGVPGTTFTLNPGWSLVHIVGYNQNQGFNLDLDTPLASLSEVMSSRILTEPQLAGDVDGNGVTDIIEYNINTSVWGVYPALAGGITPNPNWLTSFGDGESLPMVGDWNGDGRADVAVYNSGTWKFANSTGTNFIGNSMPSHLLGPGSPLTGDFNGDGIVDIATFDFGIWRFSLGTGAGFSERAEHGFTSRFSLGEPPAGPVTEPAWLVRRAGWDRSHDNHGCVTPNDNLGGRWESFREVLGSLQINEVSVDVSRNGTIDLRGQRDNYAHAKAAMYVRYSKTLTLRRQGNWDVACAYLEAAGEAPIRIEFPASGTTTVNLRAGWSTLHLIGYHQHDSFFCGFENDLVNQVDIFRPSPVPVPSRPLQHLTGDFNGDGLTDIAILEAGQFTAALSDGRTFLVQPSVSLEGFPSREVQSADFNGDGLSDLAFFQRATGKLLVSYSGGGTFLAPVALSPALSFSQRTDQDQIQVADFNGDSLPDPAVFNATTGDSELAISRGGVPDLLVGINNGLGGSTDISYRPASSLGNNFLPFLTPVVTETRVSDGLGHSYTNTYSYSGGHYDDATKEFRGFSRVEVRDEEANVATTVFHQDRVFKGRPSHSEFRDQQGRLFSHTTNLWDSVQLYPDTGAQFVRLKQTDSYFYDGQLTSKHTRSRMDYDAYGNIVASYADGEVTDPVDDRSSISAYALNETAWILNRPSMVQSRDREGNILSQRRFYYDGASLPNAPPTKGELTREEEWLDRDRTGPQNRWIGTTMSYDGFGNVLTVTDALNHSVTNTYDASGTFLVRVSNPLGHTRTMVYDPRFGHVVSSTDANNVTSTSEYDPLGRITKVIGPLDTAPLPTTRYEYDLSSSPVRVTQYTRVQSGQAKELVSYTFTDGLGRNIQTRSPAEDPTKQVVTGTVEFDAKGRVVRQWTPYLDDASASYRPHALPAIAPLLAPPVVHTYDPLGRLLTTTDPDGSSTSVAYDHWTVTTTDAKQQVKRRTSDAFGRLAQVQEFEGTGTNATLYATTAYQYDARDNLVVLTDAVGNTTTLQYDSLNRKIQMTDPDMGTWSYAYDNVDKLVAQTDARGVSILFTYDTLNRQTRKDYLIPPASGIPTNQPPVLYTYDNPLKAFSKGKLTEIADASGSSGFAYDTLGRLVTEAKTVDGTTYTIQRAYDLLGRLTAITYPNSDLAAYTYNDQGGIETITLQSPGQSVQPIINAVDYNAAGQITKMVYGNGVTTDYSYNPQTLRIQNLKSVGPGGVIQDFTYNFDSVGNIQSIADVVHSATQSFTYDSLNRLVTANGARYGSFTYAYNQVGNMTGKEGVTQNYGPLNNRPHAVTSTSTGLALTYDANGNLASKTGPGRLPQVFTFDAENHLVEVNSPVPARRLDPGWNFISLPQVTEEVPVTSVLTNFPGNSEQLTRFNASSNWFESFVNLPGTNQFATVSAARGYALYVTNTAGMILPLGDTPAAPSPQFLVPGKHLLPGPAETMSVSNWLGGLEGGVDYTDVRGLISGTTNLAAVTTVRPGQAYYVTLLRTNTWTPPSALRIENPSTVRFVYDGDGGRVKKITSSGITLFVGQSFEVSPSGQTTTYVFAGGERVAAKDSVGSLRIHHSDHLGSANVITDQGGSSVEITENTPYGSVSRHEGTVNVAHKFTGQRLDGETGLYFYNARYYDPEIGRFISSDIFAQDFVTPQTFNRYSYAANNPIIYSDPSGHFAFLIPFALATFKGALIGATFGAGMAAITGQNIGQGALMGAISGAITGGIGSFASGFQGAGAGNFLARSAISSLGSAAASGVTTAMQGGNWGKAALNSFRNGMATAGGNYIVGRWSGYSKDTVEVLGKDGQPTSALSRGGKIGINGISEGRAEIQERMALHGYDGWLYNPTRSGLADLVESGQELFFGPSEWSRSAAGVLDVAAASGGIYHFVAHSQGGMLLGNSLGLMEKSFNKNGSFASFINTPFTHIAADSAGRGAGLSKVIYRAHAFDPVSALGAPHLLPTAIIALPVYGKAGAEAHTINVWENQPGP